MRTRSIARKLADAAPCATLLPTNCVGTRGVDANLAHESVTTTSSVCAYLRFGICPMSEYQTSLPGSAQPVIAPVLGQCAVMIPAPVSMSAKEAFVPAEPGDRPQAGVRASSKMLHGAGEPLDRYLNCRHRRSCTQNANVVVRVYQAEVRCPGVAATKNSSIKRQQNVVLSMPDRAYVGIEVERTVRLHRHVAGLCCEHKPVIQQITTSCERLSTSARKLFQCRFASIRRYRGMLGWCRSRDEEVLRQRCDMLA